MKISALISLLQQYNPDAEVIICDSVEVSGWEGDFKVSPFKYVNNRTGQLVDGAAIDIADTKAY